TPFQHQPTSHCAALRDRFLAPGTLGCPACRRRLLTCRRRRLWWHVLITPVLRGEFAGRTEYQLRQAGADQHVAARRLAGSMCSALCVRRQLLAFRVLGLARVSERGGEVMRATRDAREPLHGEDA